MTKKSKNGTTIGKRILAILAALLLLLTLSASQSFAAPNFLAKSPLDSESTLTKVYTSQNYFGGDTYDSIAFDFHVFAEDVELNAHTNGNIAAYNLKANEQGFGADEKNHLGKREDNYIGTSASGIANIASNGYIVLGNSIPLKTNQQDKRIKIGQSQNYTDQSTSKKIYQETEDSINYINISKELNYLAGLSKTLSQKETSYDVILGPPAYGYQNIQVLTQGGNHYLNLEAKSFFEGNGKKILNISLPEKTTLIINVDMKNASPDALKNLVVNLNNYTNGEAIASTYCGLLWNLYDSGNCNYQFVPNNYAAVGMSDYFFGTILAPCANITYGAVNGSIIARNAKQGGKESHRFDFTGYEDPTDDSTTESTTEDSSTEITTETTTEIPSTEITTESTTEITTENTTEIPSTEITTETTTEIPSTEITTETTTEIPSTEITTETTTEIPSTEITTETTTEIPSTEITTETTTEIPSTEITTETTTEIPSTEITTETTTEIPSTEITTEITTETTTEIPSTEITTEITTETTTEIPSTEITTETTTEIPSTEITTETTTELTTEITTAATTEITTTQTTTETTNHRHIRTGDETKVFLLVTISIASLGLLVTLVICKYNRKK